VKRHAALIVGLMLLIPATSPRAAQVDTQAVSPIEVDKIEEEKVRLLLMDLVVVDKKGRTVPDLTADDFEIVVRSRKRPIDTLDVDCPAGAAEDPRAVRHPSRREAPPAPETTRRIVLALDYLHMSQMQRVEVLDYAKDLVKEGVSGNDEILVAALTGGLRIEQPFTSDHEQTLKTLHRMQYDISLWNGNFWHMSEIGYVSGVTALLDVLGTVPGSKAIVLFSAMTDVPMDLEFQEIAAIASASRCSIYPVDAWGLRGIREDRIVKGPG